MRYSIIGGCVCPDQLAPILARIQKDIGCAYASIYRGEDAKALLHKLGKHTQAEIYYEWTHGLEKNPANPPGRSTHELRSDGVPYSGPVGRTLNWWQCGIDVDDAHVPAFIAAAQRHGWVAFRPYSTGREFHHVNFARLPRFFNPNFRLGDKGLNVLLLTGRLVRLGYLPRRWFHFNAAVKVAVQHFQRDHHLTADGIVGPVTWTLVKKLAAVHRRRGRGATRVSAPTVRAIADFEGGQSADGLFHPNFDTLGNVWQIGYGHVEGVTAHSRPLTKAQAIALLHKDLDGTYVPQVLAAAKRYGWLPLTQNQLDALTSFGYNLGPGDFAPSHDLGRELRRHDLRGAATAILEYDRDANDKVEPGLQRRRHWEHDLFLKP